MDVDAPLGFGAPRDPNSPPPNLGSANPNPPKLAAPIGLGASLPPLSPKQGGKDPSIVWERFIKLAGSDPNNPRSECKYCKNQYKYHGKKNGTSSMLQHMKVCKKWPFPRDENKKLCLSKPREKGKVVQMC